MKNAEGLYFVAKTLGLDFFPDRIDALKSQITGEDIDWEKLVKISSDYLVLPAFFLSLKKHSLASCLPADLYNFLEDLTSLNRERNEKISQQVYELSSIFDSGKIDVLFLKGSALLEKGVYHDSAERILGDIDIIVRPAEFDKAVHLLIDHGYTIELETERIDFAHINHLPRFLNADRIAGVDLHSQIVGSSSGELLLSDFYKDSMLIGSKPGIRIPSEKHLLIHNILNTQVNDRAGLFGDIHLRQLYDLLLLTRYCSVSTVLEEFKPFTKVARKYVALAAYIFDAREYFDLKPDTNQGLYLVKMKHVSIRGGLVFKIYRWSVYVIYRINNYFSILGKACISKEGRRAVKERFEKQGWFQKHIKSYTRHHINK